VSDWLRCRTVLGECFHWVPFLPVASVGPVQRIEPQVAFGGAHSQVPLVAPGLGHLMSGQPPDLSDNVTSPTGLQVRYVTRPLVESEAAIDELDVGQAPGTYAKAGLLRSKDRRIIPIIKKTRLVKTTRLKVLLESDVNLSSI
jgi:hypothetical protein